MDGIKQEHDEGCENRSWCEMIKSTESSSHQTSELVAYHKIKRIFLNLADIDKEDPSHLMMCEFNGQDFQLLMD